MQAGVPFQCREKLIDPEGQYVVVLGKLDGRDIALGGIYAPNTEQLAFLSQLSGKLAPYFTGSVLLGGDFNCISDLLLDRSHPPLPNAPTQDYRGKA